jgi:hypothetical protein
MDPERPYCDASTQKCVAQTSDLTPGTPHYQVADLDWVRQNTAQCARPLSGGYPQKLESCTDPKGKQIKNCTVTNPDLNLVDSLKGCFRKELKKGGFTIEKVCLYQSVSKTFKTVQDISSYLEKGVQQRKCIKWVGGVCKQHGWGPRRGLKCKAEEVIHEGTTGKEIGQCFYEYQSPKDSHANSELVGRKEDLDQAARDFW